MKQAKKRREQLRRWTGSCTDLEPPEPRWLTKLTACFVGETRQPIVHNRDPQTVDGSVLQACIDENLEVVEFLLAHNADINQADNEGWTSLHVAASCGYSEIVECLINHGANIAAVNSDGQLPIDLAEEDHVEAMLQAEITKRGIDVEATKREEEDLMLQHARQWLNSGKIDETQHPKSGANALHVAAAKGYTEVIRLLLQTGFNVNVQDKDGWTPLHAAAHWGMEDSCRLLVEHFCDMDALNNVVRFPSSATLLLLLLIEAKRKVPPK
uniref:Uncharacterized protein n=1 Tax=Callorhinchus milii TaxID=7868 RepID=A0A4W3IQ67_CALMI